ncbi:MAG: DUF1540 domain-containing protein [Firmicutes bacterium]|jgi:hypothetical protein|nr:DUF1540 domain-containing protein [Bacillota bacterium]MDD4336056.1 DUF1540 domain-containing protein [Bacillota bacterium]MDD4791705.1 DUF1540 domain-containing protein [Bacillota bacterium]
MDNRVRCSVNNCHYWHDGNYCHASQIMITSDSIANQLPDSYDALQASTAEPTPASHIGETCCKTFAPKGTPDSALRSDRVTRM